MKLIYLSASLSLSLGEDEFRFAIYSVQLSDNYIMLTSTLGSGKGPVSGHFCSSESKMLLSSCLSYGSATTLVRVVYESGAAAAEMAREVIGLDARASWGWEVATFSERIFMTLADASIETSSLVLVRLLSVWKVG